MTDLQSQRLREIDELLAECQRHSESGVRVSYAQLRALRDAVSVPDSQDDARDADFGTRLTVSEDGVWLHLDGPNRKAGICLSAHPIAHKWADEYAAMIEANKESK